MIDPMAHYWLDKNANDRRSRILRAALEVFAEEGFRTAEVKTVAEKAGVGKATIYKYFKSKEDLLLVIVDENLSYMRDVAIERLVGQGGPMERLEAAVKAMAEFIETNRSFTRVLLQEAGDFMGDIQRRHLELVEQNLPVAQAFFATFPEGSHIRKVPTRFIMQMLVNNLIGSLYTWALTDQEIPLRDQAHANLQVIINGMNCELDLPASISPANNKDEEE